MEKFGYEVVIEDTIIDGSDNGEYSDYVYYNKLSAVFKTDKHPDIVSSLDIPAGTKAYLVWAQYTTGDSVCQSVGGGVEPLGIFLDLEAAKEMQKCLEILPEKSSHDYSLKTRDGQEYQFPYIPWFGCFNSLDDIEITSIIVGKR